MSRNILFTIGTAIFFVVTTAVIVYGQALFRQMEDGGNADAGA